MTDLRRRLLWLIPALALGLGLLVVLTARLERERQLAATARSFENQAATVAHLVREGAGRAAKALELAYEIAERQLARSLDDAPAERPAGVPPGDLPRLWSELRAHEPEELVETGTAARLGLICAHRRHDLDERIACLDAAELRTQRREMGLAPLLAAVPGHGVHYVVLQDPDGVLAGSTAEVSRWTDDPWLAGVHGAGDETLRFRHLDATAGPLYEGATPFPLPDDSVAVLRIGLDARPLLDAQAAVLRRGQIQLAVVGTTVLLLLALTALLVRWARRREAAEARLAAQEAESRHWQTIGQLAATVAHEVRNPLNTLQMAGQRLAREFTVPAAEQAEFAELLAVLRSESDRVNRVVSEFLELGRPLELKRSARSAVEAVAAALRPIELRAAAEDKRLVVDNRCTGEVVLDLQRFTQLLANLVGNGLEALAPGGTVRVTAECRDDGLHLAVADDGPGMDAATLARVQEPFVTTRASGTGLGLPLARRLTEAHGGRLDLESTPGQGTRAAVFIPATPGE